MLLRSNASLVFCIEPGKKITSGNGKTRWLLYKVTDRCIVSANEASLPAIEQLRYSSVITRDIVRFCETFCHHVLFPRDFCYCKKSTCVVKYPKVGHKSTLVGYGTNMPFKIGINYIVSLIASIFEICVSKNKFCPFFWPKLIETEQIVTFYSVNGLKSIFWL